MFKSRERYVIEIPDDVEVVADHRGVQPVSSQQALISIGNTYLGKSDKIVTEIFSNIIIDKKYVRPILDVAKYLIIGRNEKIFQVLWCMVEYSYMLAMETM